MLVVVRHGRTAANAAGLLLGRADPPLDEVGVQQAEALAESLAASAGPVRLIASPLRRTRATAEIIAARLGGAAVELDDRWLELDYGEFDGRPAGDVPAEEWRRWRSDVDYAPPGGESLRSLGDRVRGACEVLRAEAAGEADGDADGDGHGAGRVPKTTIVVSHVSPIKAAVAWALDVGDELAWRLYVAPASRTVIRVAPGGVALVGFNLVDHLPELRSAR